MWHVSMAVLTISDIVPMRRVRHKDRLLKIGRDLLAGVGTGETFEKQTDTAIHVRRRLSESELAGLSPEWLAIPAVDMAG